MYKRRVLILGHTYTAPVNRLKIEAMARDKRFEFLLVTPKRWRNHLTVADNVDTQDSGYRSRFVKVWFGWHPALYLIPHLGKIIAEFQPHLIYCEQEPICLVSLQTALASRRIPTIFYSFENIDRRDVLYNLFKPIRRACYRKSLFMAAGTREVVAVLRRSGYTKPIYITPHLGVDEKIFTPEEESSQGAARSKFVIGYAGRFVAGKDVPTLLKAASSLDDSVDWQLVLLGSGPLQGEYLDLIRRLRIGNQVQFCSSVPHDEVPDFLRSLDALVLPSKTTPTWKEQFGHVLVEGMACGVPVIGSSSGEIPRVIGEAGLVFAEGDAQDLKEKLTQLLQEPQLRRALRERGLKRVQEQYTDSRIAANMIALFEIALGMERQTTNTLDFDLG